MSDFQFDNDFSEETFDEYLVVEPVIIWKSTRGRYLVEVDGAEILCGNEDNAHCLVSSIETALDEILSKWKYDTAC